MEYTHYTGNPDEDVFVHSDKHCSLLEDLWGDMTESAAYRTVNNGDMEACPVCFEL